MKTWKTTNNYKITCVLDGGSKAFLISGNNRQILVDTGPGRLWKKLKRRLERLGILNLDYLILTHSHHDHAGSAARVKRHFLAKILIHEKEGFNLKRGENIPISGTNQLTQLLIPLLDSRFMPFLNYEPCEPDILTGRSSDPEIVTGRIKVIRTPGHTPGSQSVIVDDEIALVGDAMFGLFEDSVFPPFGNDASEIVRSWGILLKTGCRIFLPSHGTENSRALVERDFMKRNNTIYKA